MSAAARMEIFTEAVDPAAAYRRSRLRFITCGSVDDGKSTLIGRLLHEADAVPDDQLEALRRDSVRFGTQGSEPDYALLVDGLAAEREQGITIDVAYRYFETPRRAFVVTDTPGHEQYTRNMATGAAGADLALILVDASKGVLPQTRRHAYVVSLAGVRQVVLVVNKMDLVGYDRTVFERIAAAFRAATAGLGFATIDALPVSALEGDGITRRSARMPWYLGPALLDRLEQAEPEPVATGPARAVLPVQWVNRPDPDFRGYAGTLSAGVLSVGDAVSVLPSGLPARIARLIAAGREVSSAEAGQAVVATLDRPVDVSRGDVLAAAGSDLIAVRSVRARLLWTGTQPLAGARDFLIRLGAVTAGAKVDAFEHVIDIETFLPRAADGLAMNGIGRVTLAFDRPIPVAPYAADRTLGAFILIDRASNETVALGVVDALVTTPAHEASAPATAEGRFAPRLVWSALSWRLGSAALLGAGLYAVTGDAGLAAAVGVADAALRPLLRDGHQMAWSRLRALGQPRHDAPCLDGPCLQGPRP